MLLDLRSLEELAVLPESMGGSGGIGWGGSLTLAPFTWTKTYADKTEVKNTGQPQRQKEFEEEENIMAVIISYLASKF